MNFSGKTVVVTGGSGAVGRVASRRFAEAGAQVVVADMAPPPDDAGAVVYHETNVLDEASVRGLFERVASEYGGPHVLVNIAGGFRFGPSVEEMEESDWDSLLQLNLKSAFLTIKNVLPYMKAQDYGRIVSIAARSGLRGDPMVAHYSVSKGGVILLTQSVAAEVKAHDITVNAVLPEHHRHAHEPRRDAERRRLEVGAARRPGQRAALPRVPRRRGPSPALRCRSTTRP